jgi:hypothetical protein
MKQITFFKDKLVVEIPDYYEYSFEHNYSLVLYQKDQSYNIKIIVIDSNENGEQKIFYNNIKSKECFKKFSEEKYYSINNHVFQIENKKLFVTSFEIIFKNYYINIRVNTLAELKIESRNNLIKYIDKMILTINEKTNE